MTGLIKINHAEERFEKLQQEGKVRYFDSPQDKERMAVLQEALSKSKKDYIRKNADSIKSAKETFITH